MDESELELEFDGITVRKLLTLGNVKICNCSQCGKPLLGFYTGPQLFAERHDWIRKEDRYRPWKPARVAGRIKGRPFCRGCLYSEGHPGSRRSVRDVSGEWGSWDNAVKVYER